MHKIRKFHEGHSTIGEWHGSGRVVAGSRQGNGRGTAWEQVYMCELAFNTTGERQGNGRGTAWYV
jgi:hypothetical protein